MVYSEQIVHVNMFICDILSRPFTVWLPNCMLCYVTYMLTTCTCMQCTCISSSWSFLLVIPLCMYGLHKVYRNVGVDEMVHVHNIHYIWVR